MNHTTHCTNLLKAYELDVERYTKLWPNHCKACNGWGGFTEQYDPSPPGISLSPGYMTEFTPCQECYEIGKCSRCGKNMLEHPGVALALAIGYDELENCPLCGFSFTGGVDEHSLGKPEEPECLCWMDKEYNEEADRHV